MPSLPPLSTAAVCLGLALALGAIGVARATPPPQEGERPGRFSMQPTDGGFLRLDTVTGDVSLCSRAPAATFECKPVKDDRDLQNEMSRLSTENKELRAEIKRLEDMLGLGGGPHPDKGKPRLELPSEEDVDKALGYLERMFKKFRDKMKDLDSGRDGKGTPL